MKSRAEGPAQTPTEELMMEVLAARYRLGENLWTFPTRSAFVKAANGLAGKGMVWWKHGVAQGTIQVFLTDEGKKNVLLEGYVSPLEKSLIRGSRVKMHEFLDRVLDE